MNADTDYGVWVEPTAIRFERVLPGPIERVWSYLTDSEKRGLWLASGSMELKVGGLVELHFRHADLSSKKEQPPEQYREFEDCPSFTGTVTACEPPRLLSYTWAESWGGDSEVTFKLAPQDDGRVLLVLTHRRLQAGDVLVSVASGWHTHLGMLVDRLAGRDPAPFWSTHARLETEYRERLAN